VRPERRAPGELPVRVHGYAGRSSAQRPRIRRQANRDHVGALLPPGLVPSLAGRADYASTTAIYTGVSGDFMNTMMRKVLDRTLKEARG
jgi:integrase/recombinase XerC